MGEERIRSLIVLLAGAMLAIHVPVGPSPGPTSTLPAEWSELPVAIGLGITRIDFGLDGAGRPHFLYVAPDEAGINEVSYTRWLNEEWVREFAIAYPTWVGDEPVLGVATYGSPGANLLLRTGNEDVLYHVRPAGFLPTRWESFRLAVQPEIADYATAGWFQGAYARPAGSDMTEIRFTSGFPWSEVSLGTFATFADVGFGHNRSGQPQVFVVAEESLYRMSSWWGTWTAGRVADVPGAGTTAVVRVAPTFGSDILQAVVVADGAVWYFRFDDTGWRSELVASDAASCTSCTLVDLALGPGDQPYVAYEAQDGRLRLWHRHDGTWEEDPLPASLFGSWFAVALGPEGLGRFALLRDGDLWYAAQAPLPDLPQGILDATTDRCEYAPGEGVVLTLRNVGDDDLYWSGSPPLVYVLDENGALVYLAGMIMTVVIGLPPNGTWTPPPVWTQRNQTGQPVPSGLYRIGSRAGVGGNGWADFTQDDALIAIGVPCPTEGGPTVAAGGPYAAAEGEPISLAASVTPADAVLSDAWWDLDASVDADADGDASNDRDAEGLTPVVTYGDDGVFRATVHVRDPEGGMSTAQTDVQVGNMPPFLMGASVTAKVGLTLRIAGEKWHDVTLVAATGPRTVARASAVRSPGSPDDQSLHISDIEVDLLAGPLRVTVDYTPADDGRNGRPWGATPAWIVLRAADGSSVTRHHTFNARHLDTWVWTVDLHELFVGVLLEFTAGAADAGSDDLTFEWSWGDGTPDEGVTVFADGKGPDPDLSPDLGPVAATASLSHVYTGEGEYVVRLTVRDDDGGVVAYSFLVRLA